MHSLRDAKRLGMLKPPMNDLYQRARTAADYLAARTKHQPSIGIILGSGLGDFADQVQNAVAVPYADIPHFPQSTVEGHSGRLVLGTISGVPVAVMQGRIHAYEGYRMDQVTFPTRVLGLLGVQTLIVTNASGGIRPDLTNGMVVGISDHINLTGTNAALGANEPRFAVAPNSGLRFFDMSNAYSPDLLALAQGEAAAQGWTMQTGVYLAVLGPSYETPAEIRAFRTMGADLVGMSTVHEVIVARHMGMEVLGFSLVTNAAAGVSSEAINHLEVMETGARVAERFSSLLQAIVPRIANGSTTA